MSSESAKTVCGLHTSPQVPAVHQTLDWLGQAIIDRRRRLAHQASVSRQTEGDWEEMLRAHRDCNWRSNRRERLIEGLRFDLDILRHAFRRWVFRVDGSF
jgi:hypothetical protein